MPIDSRTGQFRNEVPNIEALALEWKPLQKIIAEISRIEKDYGETNQKLRTLTGSRRDAERADQAALAAAIREGKPEPEQSEVAKLEAEIDTARRRKAALATALADLEREKAAVVDQHRDAWASEVDAHVSDSAGRLEEAIAAVESERARLAALRELRTWLEAPAKPYSPSDNGATVYMMHASGRRRAGSDPTLAQLRAEARGQSTPGPDRGRATLGGWVSYAAD